MVLLRRVVLGVVPGLLAALLAAACGGGTLSVLHSGKRPTGEGPAVVVVRNSSGVGIDRLFVAKTEAVDHARAAGAAPGSSEDAALWGEDQLGNAGIAEGHTFSELKLPEGQFDVLVVDRDHREQLVKHLRLHAGGKYVLEIGTAWAIAR
jgi:hypothetical protein